MKVERRTELRVERRGEAEAAGLSTLNSIPSQLRARAVFLDRDGVLVEERGYLHRVQDMVVLPGVSAALRRLQDAGFLLFVVTNQSGIGRGYYTLAEMEQVHARLEAELARAGVHLTKIYFAPEAPGQPSRGRKPSPQFLFDARDEFGVCLARSYVVGDKLIDLECGWNAGVGQCLLVRTGYGAEVERQRPAALARAVVVDDLPAAAEWILGQAGRPAAESSRTAQRDGATAGLLQR